jgi:hypothetical protein
MVKVNERKSRVRKKEQNHHHIRIAQKSNDIHATQTEIRLLSKNLNATS